MPAETQTSAGTSLGGSVSSPVSVLDLTAGQVETIEQELGLPVTRWAEAPSALTLYIKILAAANGEPEDKYRAMKTRDILELVTLDEADPNP